MPESPSPERWTALGAALLVLLFFAQSFTASRMKGPTSDEPYHIAAGISYIAKGRIQLNPQHPPLLKELSGLSLAAAGIGWPDNQYARTAWSGVEDMTPVVGSYLMAEQGIERVLLWARLPLMVFSSLLGAILYLWGRRMVGAGAALGAVALFALDPTFLAHSYIVATDCGVAVAISLFLWMLWRFLERPTAVRLALCGLALGVTLGAKFSGVVIPPLAALLLAAAALAARRPAAVGLPWFLQPYGRASAPAAAPAAPAKRKAKGAAPPAAPAAPGLVERLWQVCAGSAGAVAAMCVVAFLALQAIYLFPSDPLAYLAGWRKVNADHDPLYMMYMAGEVKRHFASYYLVASLVKLPLPFLALILYGLWQVRRLPRLTKVFLLLPSAALFAGYSVFSDNLGIRYIIPVLPFAYLIGGLGLAALARSGSKAARAAAATACLWMALAAVGIYPDHLSYFNEMACVSDDLGKVGLDGGSRCGPWWLDDSNVDWGGSLPQLKQWLDRHAPGRIPKLAFLGSFPPRAYGIEYARLEPERMLPEPAPGLYVVSGHYVARIPPLAAHERYPLQAAWLRSRKPTAIVARAYWVYDVSGAPAGPGNRK